MATERGSGFGLTEGETAEVQRRVPGGRDACAGAPQPPIASPIDEEILEQLHALGYIN